ncbi:uncharacterized protein LOC144476523 [Augochlora pura]
MASSSREDQLAIRFLIKRTKKFNFGRHPYREVQGRTYLKCPPSPDCLHYLGLSARSAEKLDQQKQKNPSDFKFREPKIYDCGYCAKYFFHKLNYRRHMIRHIRKAYWCHKCRQGFISLSTRKLHQLFCRC